MGLGVGGWGGRWGWGWGGRCGVVGGVRVGCDGGRVSVGPAHGRFTSHGAKILQAFQKRWPPLQKTNQTRASISYLFENIFKIKPSRWIGRGTIASRISLLNFLSSSSSWRLKKPGARRSWSSRRSILNCTSCNSPFKYIISPGRW